MSHIVNGLKFMKKISGSDLLFNENFNTVYKFNVYSLLELLMKCLA